MENASESFVSKARMAPDIVILAVEWRTRALLRAQLIEEGFEVAATDAWPTLWSYFHGAKPRLVIVDIRSLPDSMETLRQMRAVFPPDRVLVLHALGAADHEQLERLGFHIIARPVAIQDIVTTARMLLTTD